MMCRREASCALLGLAPGAAAAGRFNGWIKQKRTAQR